MNKSKINIFMPIKAYYPSQIGGPCNSVYSLVSVLPASEYYISVYTTTFGITNEEVQENIKIENENGDLFYSTFYKIDFKLIKTFFYKIKEANIVQLSSFLTHILFYVF